MMRKGMTLVEVLLAAAILATVLLGMAMFQTVTLKVSSKEKDRAFAIQKAVQMMEEVLAYQVTSGTKAEQGIDTLAQGDNDYSFVMTIDPKVTDPKMALSGNVDIGGGAYKFVRQIRVEPLSNEKGARRVTISVFKGDGKSTPGIIAGTSPMAFVTNIVKAEAAKTQPTQVYDMYFIDIENTIGVWSDPNTLRDIISGSIDLLKGNNPGLEVRTHWVRRLAYGRDPYYKPVGNKAGASNNAGAVPGDWVYFYPGKLSANDMRYNPDVLKGQMRVDGVDQNAVVNGTGVNNYYSRQVNYSFADQFNHAVRWPEEETKYSTAVNAAKATNSPLPEPSLRMLMEWMASGELKNAIVVNLHAELVPLVPLRNYSDAARVPLADSTATVRNMFGVDAPDAATIAEGAAARLVTHPRRLKVNRNTSDDFGADKTVELRVYPHVYNSGTAAAPEFAQPPDSYRSAQIVLRDLADRIERWNNNGQAERNVQIDVLHMDEAAAEYTEHSHTASENHTWDVPDLGNHRSQTILFWPIRHSHFKGVPPKYEWVRIWPNNDALDGAAVAYNATVAGKYLETIATQNNDDNSKDLQKGDIIIKLKNIDYTHDFIDNGANNRYGLHPEVSLHGFNYFPDPRIPGLDDNLPEPNFKAPRNTMRFRIRFNAKEKGRYDVVTTIGAEPTLQAHQAPNRSITHQWVDEDPPFSEQYQVVGDPRSYPYEDANYNRYFGDFTSKAYQTTNTDQPWNAMPGTANGWHGLGEDLPRYLELWRRGFLGGNAIYLNPAGFSFYYVGLGGDISTESKAAKPYTGGGGTTTTNEFTGTTHGVAHSSANGWYAKPWLGELYPDDEWNNWRLFGNLPSSSYRRKVYSSLPKYMSTGNNPDRNQNVQAYGSVSFYNGGSSGGDGDWFTHIFAAEGSTNALTTNGQQVANSFKLYLNDEFPSIRPFTLQEGSIYKPQDWMSADSRDWRTRLEWGLVSGDVGYYKQNGDATSQSVAPIAMRRDGKAAYMVMSAAAPSGDSGTTTLARLSLAAGLQGFFDMAAPKFKSGADRGHNAVKLLPRVNITEPVEDTQLTGNKDWLKWDINWKRWNLENYSNQFTDYGSFGTKPKLVYNIKYSTNGGTSWIGMRTGNVVRAGVYDDAEKVTGTQYEWKYNGWSNKEYLVRLECYRDEDGYRQTHYAYHQVAYTIAH
jgi:Tfp pilus assembly protein PilE